MPKPNTKDPLIVSKVIQLSAEGRTIKEICENIHKSNKTVIKVQKENYTQIQELKKELTSIITEKTKQLYTDTIKLSLEKAQLALKYITPEKIAAASSAANATTYAILLDKYHIGTGQATEAVNVSFSDKAAMIDFIKGKATRDETIDKQPPGKKGKRSAIGDTKTTSGGTPAVKQPETQAAAGSGAGATGGDLSGKVGSNGGKAL